MLAKPIIEGWVEEGDKLKRTIPIKCPRCNGKLYSTDASRINGMIFVWCRNLECRWCELYYA